MQDVVSSAARASSLAEIFGEEKVSFLKSWFWQNRQLKEQA
jgi:hypothetical protein